MNKFYKYIEYCGVEWHYSFERVYNPVLDELYFVVTLYSQEPFIVACIDSFLKIHSAAPYLAKEMEYLIVAEIEKEIELY